MIKIKIKKESTYKENNFEKGSNPSENEENVQNQIKYLLLLVKKANKNPLNIKEIDLNSKTLPSFLRQVNMKKEGVRGGDHL